MIALAVVTAYIVIGLLAPVLAPYGESQIAGQQYEPLSSSFLLGTDQLGRDMLSRLIYGIRNSVSIAVVTTFICVIVGSALGISAAVMGGWTDNLLSRAMDVLMAIPPLIFALVLISIMGPSVGSLIVVIASLDSTRMFRLSRAVSLDVARREFVEVARLQGERLPWIVVREILPNIVTPLVAEAGARFCFVFLTVSALSFLGLGIQPPSADLGSMVRDNATLLIYGDLRPIIPAIAIAVLVVSVNSLADYVVQHIDESVPR